MAPLRQLFEAAAGADEHALLSAPTPDQVVELLREGGETLSVGDLEQMYGE